MLNSHLDRLSPYDLGWIVGFLEGEGTFGKNGNTLTVSATQVQRQPVDRLHQLLKGDVCTYRKDDVKGGTYHIWHAYGVLAVEIMIICYPLLSPRRQEQVRTALLYWTGRSPEVRARGGFSRESRIELKNRITQFFEQPA